jgi:hypothetical protein|tara:strand:+ start:690 stop:857 length:168 start_codon:yes stop_codon:yes gene_type:complete
MAIHSQDGQKQACGTRAQRLAVEEGIEAMLSTGSDMLSSTSCPRQCCVALASTDR